MVYYWIITVLLILFVLGYTKFKFEQLKYATKIAFAQLEQGLQAIIDDSGENFEEILKNVLTETIDEFLGVDYEVLDTMDPVGLLINVFWDQKEDYTIFDFSHYDKNKGINTVGMQIYTTMKETKAFKKKVKDKDVCAMYVDNTILLWVKDKDDDGGNAYWLWPEQEEFLDMLSKGMYGDTLEIGDYDEDESEYEDFEEDEGEYD